MAIVRILPLIQNMRLQRWIRLKRRQDLCNILWICLATNVLARNICAAKLTIREMDEFVSNEANYDKREWPTYGQAGNPTIIDINMGINTMSSFSELDMEYYIELFIRLDWMDHRLKEVVAKENRSAVPPEGSTRGSVPGGEYLLIQSQDFLDKLWRPDLFLSNAKKTWKQNVLLDNMYVRVWPETGRVFTSERVSCIASCNLILADYPFDEQTCYLVIESYAYTTDQLQLNWEHGIIPIQLIGQMQLPQFQLTGYKFENCTATYPTGTFPCAKTVLQLSRQSGHHMLQSYVPTVLIVSISWVSFWLEATAVPARITLGVTTLLTVTTLTSGIKSTLPPVSYPKAIDVWINACTVFVFAALLEFTLAANFTRKYQQQKMRMRSSEMESENREEAAGPGEPGRAAAGGKGGGASVGDIAGIDAARAGSAAKASRGVRNGQLPSVEDQGPTRRSTISQPPLGKTAKEPANRGVQLDRVSRVAFPGAFVAFNIAYWAYYYK